MPNYSLEILLLKYIDGDITSEELILLENSINELDDDEFQIIINKILSSKGQSLDDLPIDTRILERLEGFIGVFNKTNEENLGDSSPKMKSRIRYKEFLLVAVLLIIGSACFYHFIVKNQVISEALVDVSPAQSLVNISLGEGREILIDSTKVGLVFQENGLSIYRGEDGEIVYNIDTKEYIASEYIVVSTPKGGYSKLRLNDGTLVSMNAASVFKYPLIFGQNSREVYAEGEIYFEVHKDQNRPFKVHSEKQTIEVLGTSFNLVSNAKEATTTLIEGAVQLHVNNKRYLLKPGQQAHVRNDVEIKDVLVETEVDWKNEQFVFDNSSFIDILREVENWYDVEFSFTGDTLKEHQLSGTLSRRLKLSELLKVLSINTNYEFEIQGRRVLIK